MIGIPPGSTPIKEVYKGSKLVYTKEKTLDIIKNGKILINRNNISFSNNRDIPMNCEMIENDNDTCSIKLISGSEIPSFSLYSRYDWYMNIKLNFTTNKNKIFLHRKRQYFRWSKTSSGTQRILGYIFPNAPRDNPSIYMQKMDHINPGEWHQDFDTTLEYSLDDGIDTIRLYPVSLSCRDSNMTGFNMNNIYIDMIDIRII